MLHLFEEQTNIVISFIDIYINIIVPITNGQYLDKATRKKK
jgi:hypothetical protein